MKEMSLIIVGINHKTADVSLREKVAFPPEIISDALTEVQGLADISEAVLLSTCNRTELYVDGLSVKSSGADQSQNWERPLIQEKIDEIIDWLAGYHKLQPNQLRTSIYSFTGEEVVKHLMKVSCGLDSLILGEPQILGQIKSAFALSKELKLIGPSLSRTFNAAFSIAKEVRTDTAIGESPVSVAYAATLLAERIFSDLESLSILLIGAGRTIELVARHFAEKSVSRITVANRTLDNALEVADKFNGKDVKLSESYKVDGDTFIEEFLPKVLQDRSTIVVVDKQGDTKGYITEKELAVSLSKTGYNESAKTN